LMLHFFFIDAWCFFNSCCFPSRIRESLGGTDLQAGPRYSWWRGGATGGKGPRSTTGTGGAGNGGRGGNATSSSSGIWDANHCQSQSWLRRGIIFTGTVPNQHGTRSIGCWNRGTRDGAVSLQRIYGEPPP
jgi:hypothetical protein